MKTIKQQNRSSGQEKSWPLLFSETPFIVTTNKKPPKGDSMALIP
jgi:hypothetical protein